MPILNQLIANGLIAGSIYALMAAGFSLMYGLQRFMNIEQGAIAAVGGPGLAKRKKVKELYLGG